VLKNAGRADLPEESNEHVADTGTRVVVTAPGAALAQNPFALSEKDEIELGRHAAGVIEKDIRLVEEPTA